MKIKLLNTPWNGVKHSFILPMRSHDACDKCNPSSFDMNFDTDIKVQIHVMRKAKMYIVATNTTVLVRLNFFFLFAFEWRLLSFSPSSIVPSFRPSLLFSSAWNLAPVTLCCRSNTIASVSICWSSALNAVITTRIMDTTTRRKANPNKIMKTDWTKNSVSRETYFPMHSTFDSGLLQFSG